MHFADLRIYQIALKLETNIFQFLVSMSDYQNSKLIDQTKRSVSSVSANIVEGCGRKNYPRDFIRFLYIALGSSDETQHHIRILYNRNCLKENSCQNLEQSYRNLSVRILNLIKFIKKEHGIKYEIFSMRCLTAVNSLSIRIII